MDSFNAFTKPLAVGHGAVQALLRSETITYQEKIDGSQLSFGVGIDGKIFARSRSRVFDIDAPDGMFEKAAESIKERAHLLHPGWTYRGEYLNKCRHNVLRYGRVPKGHIAIFDISIGENNYLADNAAVRAEAERVGLDYCQVFCVAPFSSSLCDTLLENISMLGDVRIEGVVLKDHTNGGYFCRDGKPAMAKYVSPEFKEVTQQNFKPAKDVGVKATCAMIAQSVCTEGRWRKAVQHLREDGGLSGTPADIGPLIKELQKDVVEECREEIEGMLWSRFNKEIVSQCSRGFAEWYKRQLLEGIE